VRSTAIICIVVSKFWFRQYETEMSLERSLREAERILREAENKTKVITKKFSDVIDEEATEVISCKMCLINALKVVFTSCGHSACFSCADKLKDCRTCRKTILKKIKIFL